ncbi:MAG: aminomethyl-transferring glycine dehydrogenase subunit GcvPA [Eubacteriaceae bacterium]|nr:aminomethyl-transferring glycine dehydrogenase subunit GcvPA [Eubacteriaceae bacterium]
MDPYIPNGPEQVEKMLKFIGMGSVEELYKQIPEGLRLSGDLSLPDAMPEATMVRELSAISAKNANTDQLACFLGAGVYDRLVPSVVSHIAGRSEYYTAYTPYQPEIAQGTLQCIFEFQTMIAELAGMDFANASMYDGASACAEAAIMAVRNKKRFKIAISEGLNPEFSSVLETYARFNGITVARIPLRGGLTDYSAAGDSLEGASALVVSQPNFLGAIEDIDEAGRAIKAHSGQLIVATTNPHSLAVLKEVSLAGADILVGDAQPFGMDLSYGGAHLGFMAATADFMRKAPGRIAGQTVDSRGNRAYVLTLQAREQHIRREKATSNICTNAAHNALKATVYMSALGFEGIKDVCMQSMSKARHLQQQLSAYGIKLLYDIPYVDEFAVVLNEDAISANKRLLEKGYIGGLPLKEYLAPMGLNVNGDVLDRAMLIAVTEKRTRQEIDGFAQCLGEIS